MQAAKELKGKSGRDLFNQLAALGDTLFMDDDEADDDWMKREASDDDDEVFDIQVSPPPSAPPPLLPIPPRLLASPRLFLFCPPPLHSAALAGSISSLPLLPSSFACLGCACVICPRLRHALRALYVTPY